jgi:hypothetical protein
MNILFFCALFVISTKEKSSREGRQRLDFRCRVTCEDFSFVEMTNYALSILAIDFTHNP